MWVLCRCVAAACRRRAERWVSVLGLGGDNPLSTDTATRDSVLGRVLCRGHGRSRPPLKIAFFCKRNVLRLLVGVAVDKTFIRSCIMARRNFHTLTSHAFEKNKRSKAFAVPTWKRSLKPSYPKA